MLVQPFKECCSEPVPFLKKYCAGNFASSRYLGFPSERSHQMGFSCWQFCQQQMKVYGFAISEWFPQSPDVFTDYVLEARRQRVNCIAFRMQPNFFSHGVLGRRRRDGKCYSKTERSWCNSQPHPKLTLAALSGSSSPKQR